MKLDDAAREWLTRELKAGWERSGLTISEVAKRSRVDQGQASRICRGEIKTLSHNVMQICNTLKVGPVPATLPASEAEAHRLLADHAIALWDRTPEGMERLLRLFRSLDDLRKQGVRKS